MWIGGNMILFFSIVISYHQIVIATQENKTFKSTILTQHASNGNFFNLFARKYLFSRVLWWHCVPLTLTSVADPNLFNKAHRKKCVIYESMANVSSVWCSENILFSLPSIVAAPIFCIWHAFSEWLPRLDSARVFATSIRLAFTRSTYTFFMLFHFDFHLMPPSFCKRKILDRKEKAKKRTKSYCLIFLFVLFE